jgi:ABC-type dipeptide/oligopeptide/nickel transport system permease subunit
MLLSVISGEDLMALFQGTQLSVTIGGILTAFIGAIIGGSLGGFISGPYEEVY